MLIIGRILLGLTCIPLVIPSQVCLCHDHTHAQVALTGMETAPNIPEPIPVHSCCSHKKKHRELGSTSHSENQSVTERDSSKNQSVTERDSWINQYIIELDSETPFPPIHDPYCPAAWEHNPIAIIHSAQKGLCVAFASILISVNLLENRSGSPPPYVNFLPTYFFQIPLYVAFCRFNI